MKPHGCALPIRPSTRAAWLGAALLLAGGPAALLQANPEVIIGKIQNYYQNVPGMLDLATSPMPEGDEGAYRFFAEVIAFEPLAGTPTMTLPAGTNFFADHPGRGFQLHFSDPDEEEWRMEYASNNPAVIDAYFPAGTYTVNAGGYEATLTLTADPLPDPAVLDIQGNGEWRDQLFIVPHGEPLLPSAPDIPDFARGYYLLPEGEDLNLQTSTFTGYTMPGVHLIWVEAWSHWRSNLGIDVFDAGQISADILGPDGPVFSEVPYFEGTLPFSEVPPGLYNLEVGFSTVDDAQIDDDNFVVGIREASTRMLVMVARDWRYSDWQEEQFSPAERADPGISGPEVDLTGHRVSNLMRYALGMSARQIPDQRMRMTRVTPDGFLEIVFPRRKLSDLTYTVETGPDLTHLGPDPAGTQLRSVLYMNEEFDLVTVRVLTPVADDAMRFIRLRVTLPTPR